jgi:hypothetical protein
MRIAKKVTCNLKGMLSMDEIYTYNGKYLMNQGG